VVNASLSFDALYTAAVLNRQLPPLFINKVLINKLNKIGGHLTLWGLPFYYHQTSLMLKLSSHINHYRLPTAFLAYLCRVLIILWMGKSGSGGSLRILAVPLMPLTIPRIDHLDEVWFLRVVYTLSFFTALQPVIN